MINIPDPPDPHNDHERNAREIVLACASEGVSISVKAAHIYWQRYSDSMKKTWISHASYTDKQIADIVRRLAKV